MPRADPQERKRKLKEKEARVKAELQRLEAREREAERKRALRRAILTGAMLIDKLQRGEEKWGVVLGQLDSFLTRSHDRAVFGLPPPEPARTRARALREEGKSLRRIAEILEAEAVPLPAGRGKKWHHKAVARMFQRFEAQASPPPLPRPQNGPAPCRPT